MEALLKKFALPTIVLIWSAAYFFEVIQYSERNHYLIKPVFIVMVILYVVNVITDWRELKQTKAESDKGDEKKPELSAQDKQVYIKITSVMGSMIVYVALLPILGFIISTLALIVGLLLLMQVRSVLPLALLPVILTTFLYVAFKIWLGIPLPAGILGF